MALVQVIQEPEEPPHPVGLAINNSGPAALFWVFPLCCFLQ